MFGAKARTPILGLGGWMRIRGRIHWRSLIRRYQVAVEAATSLARCANTARAFVEKCRYFLSVTICLMVAISFGVS